MNARESSLQKRLISYAGAIGVSAREVSSMKLRPVMAGAQYTDVFGFAHANAYMYESEYQAGQAVCHLSPAEGSIATADLCVGHPFPWTQDTAEFIRVFTGVDPPVTWVQHETGLEILALATDIATLIAAPVAIFQAFEAIREKVSANARANKTDRYHKEVCKIRIEVRTLDESGNLKQELIICQDIHRPLEHPREGSEFDQ